MKTLTSHGTIRELLMRETQRKIEEIKMHLNHQNVPEENRTLIIPEHMVGTLTTAKTPK